MKESPNENHPFLDDMSDEDVGMLADYDQEYQETSASVSRQISSLKSCDPTKTKEIIEAIRSDLEECRTCVRNMDFEVRNLSGTTRNKWKDRIEQYKSDIKTLNRDFTREKESAQRSELFSGATDRANLGQTDEQARMLSALETEEKNTDMLRDTAQMLHGTEEQAIEIQQDLKGQGDRIRNVRRNLIEGNTTLGRIGRGIRRMSRRQAMMSVMWCFIILVVLAVIGIILWLKLK